MPELPEVQTTVTQLAPQVEGHLITQVVVSWERSLGGQPAESLEAALVGRRIHRVRRRAKWIVIDLQHAGREAGSVLVHLRMSGRLYVRPGARPAERHVRVQLGLGADLRLDFLDVRKFGRLFHTPDASLTLSHLGVEPLDPEFTPAVLEGLLRGRARAVKPLLLDQTVVAGLGNIYVDEALFRAGIHPLRMSHRLHTAQVAALQESICTVLEQAIAADGASFDAFYRTPQGQPGRFQSQFLVYGRTGQACRRCEGTILRLVVAQRGTHVCARCQPAPRRPRAAGARGRSSRR